MLNYISFHTAELDKIQITIIAALLIRPVFEKNRTSRHEICNFDQNFGQKYYKQAKFVLINVK